MSISPGFAATEIRAFVDDHHAPRRRTTRGYTDVGR